MMSARVSDELPVVVLETLYRTPTGSVSGL
jgi:hypothetical protein